MEHMVLKNKNPNTLQYQYLLHYCNILRDKKDNLRESDIVTRRQVY